MVLEECWISLYFQSIILFYSFLLSSLKLIFFITFYWLSFFKYSYIFWHYLSFITFRFFLLLIFFLEIINIYFFRKLFSSQSVGLLPRRVPRVRNQIEPEGEPRNRVPETKPLIELRRISKESSEFRLSTGSDGKETSSFAQVCWNWNLWQCLTSIKPGFNIRIFFRND